MKQNGIEWNRLEWNGMKWNGMLTLNSGDYEKVDLQMS